ncbi:hypothetical protein [Prosthecobacter fluviatilis]|uniref:Uncharacterized protein n=1 Tax=Prosthecobacter fluviatilis TaxID=445931 RepID=A0ABW0KYH7_9BACT
MKCRFLLLFSILLLMAAPLSAAEMRGMWIYKTDEIAASPEASDALFDFCAQRHITDLFWQVHFTKLENGGRELKNAAPTRAFIQHAHARSLRIHALFGDPSHTLRAKHGIVLASVDGILAFNREEPRDAHFDGVHLDIEPHGLLQWKKADPAQKCDLLTQFVEVNHKAVSRAHTAEPGLIYGVDIVFWLDKTTPEGKPAYPVNYQGVAKDAAQHLLDCVDHVAIMSYRDTAEGKNGIVSLVAKTIAYADTTKAKVFVGAKMANIGPKMEGFYGKTETQMMSALRAVDDTYTSHPGYAGLAFFMFEAFKIMTP